MSDNAITVSHWGPPFTLHLDTETFPDTVSEIFQVTERWTFPLNLSALNLAGIQFALLLICASL